MDQITAHVGGIFRHKKTGGVYVVLMFATIEATMTRAVIYRNMLDEEEVWVRPVSEFEDGRFDLVHASDCATHNAPALPVGECDCQ